MDRFCTLKSYSCKLNTFIQKIHKNFVKMRKIWRFFGGRLYRWVTDYNRPINRSFFRRLIGIGRTLLGIVRCILSRASNYPIYFITRVRVISGISSPGTRVFTGSKLVHHISWFIGENFQNINSKSTFLQFASKFPIDNTNFNWNIQNINDYFQNLHLIV